MSSAATMEERESSAPTTGVLGAGAVAFFLVGGRHSRVAELQARMGRDDASGWIVRSRAREGRRRKADAGQGRKWWPRTACGQALCQRGRLPRHHGRSGGAPRSIVHHASSLARRQLGPTLFHPLIGGDVRAPGPGATVRPVGLGVSRPICLRPRARCIPRRPRSGPPASFMTKTPHKALISRGPRQQVSRAD